jgi:hypothetical protein
MNILAAWVRAQHVMHPFLGPLGNAATGHIGRAEPECRVRAEANRGGIAETQYNAGKHREIQIALHPV